MLFRRVRAQPTDAAFAWRVYRDCMQPLSEPLGAWHAEREQRVVHAAFVYREAELLVAGSRHRHHEEKGGVATRLGWLHVRRTARALELWQLFVTPEHRGSGIGTTVLGELQQQARSEGVVITLAVLRNNPARRLYKRVGFVTTGRTEHQRYMCWWP